jgi:UDP-N-acetylglucosamine acyltransferase
VVFDRAFISGNCLVHQFCRVGTLALMQGGCAISKDLPPFCVSLRVNEMCGLNVVGLRRAGFNAEQRIEIKKVYQMLFRGDKNTRAAVTEAQELFSSTTAKVLINFVASAKRGTVADVRRANAETQEES